MRDNERAALVALLRKRREELGLSARQVAFKAGIDPGSITWLEQGKVAQPRFETVRALAEALDLPLADVYAAANWLPEGELPSLRPYMRAKYGDDLSDDDLAKVERYVQRLSRQSRGPTGGEDE
jgi:transcriptional regulator with XRE-family HTH domain